MSESGYKNPPKHSQFPKGCSGNPAGRPKGSKNTLKLLDAVLEQKMNGSGGRREIGILH